MVGIKERASEQIDDISAEPYIRQSILDPAAFIVLGYRDLMYTDYGEHITEQDVADLTALLVGL